jgi:hypothetical protein
VPLQVLLTLAVYNVGATANNARARGGFFAACVHCALSLAFLHSLFAAGLSV